jgi:hypothetical protein
MGMGLFFCLVWMQFEFDNGDGYLLAGSGVIQY